MLDLLGSVLFGARACVVISSLCDHCATICAATIVRPLCDHCATIVRPFVVLHVRFFSAVFADGDTTVNMMFTVVSGLSGVIFLPMTG